MRIQIYNTLTFCFLSLTLLLGSCLKENYDGGRVQPTHSTGQPPNVVELTLTATSNENFYLLAVDNSDRDTIVDFVPVTLASATPAPADLHVTVTLDDALISDYNAAHGTAYEPAPPALFSIVNAEVIIPAGSNTGFLKLAFKPSDFIGHDYAFGFKITGIKESGYVSSGNLSSGVAAITIKNKYDGIYNAVGVFTHPNPDFTGDFNSEWSCATSGPSSVTFQLNTTVLFGVIIEFVVDEATNLVTVNRIGGALDPYDPALNYYVPATRTFHYNFGYSGGTRTCVGTAVYVGPR